MQQTLYAGDTNGVEDIFIRDLLTQTTRRISVSSAGTQANRSSVMLVRLQRAQTVVLWRSIRTQRTCPPATSTTRAMSSFEIRGPSPPFASLWTRKKAAPSAEMAASLQTDPHTVTATPKPGWHFVNWTEGGAEVSTDASYTFTLNGNRTLVAHFAQITYTVTTSADPAGGGTTSGDGTYPAGSSRTVTATPNSGLRLRQLDRGWRRGQHQRQLHLHAQQQSQPRRPLSPRSPTP